MELAHDFDEFIASLTAHGVEFVVVGAYALAFHGAPRFTGDLDILVRPSLENAARVLEALEAFGFPVPDLSPEAIADRRRMLQMGVPPVQIHVMSAISGVEWDEAWSDRVVATLGRKVELIHYDDQSTPANVPGIYTKLISVDKVDLLLGPYATNFVAPAMPTIIQHNKMTISLTAIGINRHFNYNKYFSMVPVGPDGKGMVYQAIFKRASAHVRRRQKEERRYPSPGSSASISARSFAVRRFGTQIGNGKAERLERLEDPRGVFERGLNEDIQVAGESRGAVERECIRPNNDELNPMGSQGRDELVEVGRQLHRTASAGIRQPRRARREVATASSARLGASALPQQETSSAGFSVVRAAFGSGSTV